MKKRNGFTTIELIITITLTLVIMGFLLEILFILKEIYVSNGIRTELLIKQALISHKINQDFTNYEVENIINCLDEEDECIEISFKDGPTKKLSIDRNENILKYGDFVTKLVDNSKFGEPIATSETIIGVPHVFNDTIIQIKIPITYPTYDEDFGINIIYQYNSTIISTIGDNFSF